MGWCTRLLHLLPTRRLYALNATDASRVANIHLSWHSSCLKKMNDEMLDGEKIVRQEQQPDNTHRFDFLPSAEAGNTVSPAHSLRAAQVRKDAESLELKQGQLAADIAALAHLLNAPQLSEQLITAALDVSARLMPHDWKLRLFESIDAGTSVRELVSSRKYQVDEATEKRMTLGFGEALDHRVMREHIPFETERLISLPLIDASGVLVGALVAVRESAATGSRVAADDALLAVVCAHLTALLVRSTAERLHKASTVAMQALTSLVLPAAGGSTLDERGTTHAPLSSDILEAAQNRVLTSAVAAVDKVIEVAGYANCVMPLAVTPTQTGEWRLLLARASLEKTVPLLSSEMWTSISHLFHRSKHDSLNSLEVGGESHPDIWMAFMPLRECIGTLGGIEVFHLTLLPVTDGEQQLVALLCLAWRTAAHISTARLLSIVTEIAIGATAGVSILQLAEHAQAEGRARDAFISLSAHELRSPLTSIKGYSQLLMRQSRKNAIPEPMLHSVEAIEQQSVRMAEMVGALLDASRIQRGVLEVQVSPVDLVPLVRKVVERRAALYPQHTITFTVAEGSVIAVADVQRVEQVLRALIDNAVHHMPRGGVVAVELTRQESMALFSVRDQGIGIPEGERKRIFEYLYRTTLSEKKNLSGLGLGLYISHHLVERFGGTLWLEASSIDETSGSEFRFTLPLEGAFIDYMQHDWHFRSRE